jgi:hypothetical protein
VTIAILPDRSAVIVAYDNNNILRLLMIRQGHFQTSTLEDIKNFDLFHIIPPLENTFYRVTFREIIDGGRGISIQGCGIEDRFVSESELVCAKAEKVHNVALRILPDAPNGSFSDECMDSLFALAKWKLLNMGGSLLDISDKSLLDFFLCCKEEKISH